MLPADTMAVVVGIEDYQADQKWRLNGPALDACRFARWLTARGVPADRITLLVSPLPENAHTVEEQSQGYRVRAAAYHVTVRDVFTRYLPSEASSLLILYWGGHGVIEKEERRLFYTDATTMDKRNLNLSSLLRSMRSSTFARHPQQLVFVDACQNLATELGWKGSMPGDEFPERDTEPRRDQCVLLAASPGERARNLDALKTGLFSQVLREALDTLPAGTWPPDADRLRDFVTERFEQPCPKGSTQQVPSYLWFRSRSSDDTLVFASGPADEGEVKVYLTALIRRLDTAPWPGIGFGGPALPPAAVERKLGIEVGSGRDEQVLGADDLARQCARLVVLGGPGSGKTWLAKRTVRLCAEAALKALAAGANLNKVELPLYITCAQLADAPHGEAIRSAIVASALGELPDLGGVRILATLRAMFEERKAPTLLVADSLDEAHGADDRIRLADTLPPAWRIVLTTRPGSWKGQLAVAERDPSRRVGVLQPLRYPDDVEPFVAAWFSGRPASGANLLAELQRRPALRQAATVPLILAFYCIVGGDEPLPDRRVDLYGKVIRHMLTGQWRGGASRDPDPEACLKILRRWAWFAAGRNPVSGIGDWADEFLTPRVSLSPDDREALDHVAVPLGPSKSDPGMTRRRFVHRSVQEHLVAGYVALRPARAAARELLNHLWYDPDWEYAAPAALAMHRKKDKVLQELVFQATLSSRLPADFSQVDACWEIRKYLARVALESREADWSAESADLIRLARREIAQAQHFAELDQGVPGWEASDREVRETLGAMLRETELWRAIDIVRLIARLHPLEEELRKARDVLLDLLDQQTHQGDADVACNLARAVADLGPTAEELQRARSAVLDFLALQRYSSEACHIADVVAHLSPTKEDLTQVRDVLLYLLAEHPEKGDPAQLVVTVAKYAATAAERRTVRRALLGLLTEPRDEWDVIVNTVAQLAVSAAERREVRTALLNLLSRPIGKPALIADVVAQLAVSAAERREVRTALPNLLSRPIGEPARNPDVVAKPAVSAPDRRRTRKVLLGRLTQQHSAEGIWDLVAALADTDPTPKERRQIWEVLLGLAGNVNVAAIWDSADRRVELDPTPDELKWIRGVLVSTIVQQSSPWAVWKLTETLAKLQPTEDQLRSVKATLLRLVAGETEGAAILRLAQTLSSLNPTAEERHRTREAVLNLLPIADPIEWILDSGFWELDELLAMVTKLAVSADERAGTRRVLLTKLNDAADPEQAIELATVIGELGPKTSERRRTRRILLSVLAHARDDRQARQLALFTAALKPEDHNERRQVRETLLRLADGLILDEEGVQAAVELAVTTEERGQVREALLKLLARRGREHSRQWLAPLAARLAVTSEERRQVRSVLLRLLEQIAGTWQPWREIYEAAVSLAVTAEERDEVRDGVLRLLACPTDGRPTGRLAALIDELRPTASDLSDLQDSNVRLTQKFLGAVRQNSSLTAWLNILPTLRDIN